MEVKEAFIAAKQHVAEIFDDEQITNLGLEEVRYDDGKQKWEITLGFFRPWNADRSPLAAWAGDPAARRTYKVVTISDADGKILSITNRD